MSRLETVELHHQGPQHFLLRFVQRGSDSNNNGEKQDTSVVSVCSLDHTRIFPPCISPLLLQAKKLNVVIRDDYALRSSKQNAFTPATLELTDLCADVKTISDPETRDLMRLLFAKQCVVSHGAVVLAKVTKVVATGAKGQGRALTLKLAGSGVAAAAALPSSDDIDVVKSAAGGGGAALAVASGQRVRDAFGEDIFVDYNPGEDREDDAEANGDAAAQAGAGGKTRAGGASAAAAAVAPGDTVSARILYVQSDSGLVACSVQRDVVNRGPVTRRELQRSFRSVGAMPGRVVRARLLLHCAPEDTASTGIASHVAVVEITAQSNKKEAKKKNNNSDDEHDDEDEDDAAFLPGNAIEQPSALCFVRLGPVASAAKLRQEHPVGSAVDVLLQYVPGPQMLDALPVCVGVLHSAQLVRPALQLRPFSRDTPLVPFVLAATAAGSSTALIAAASSAKSSSSSSSAFSLIRGDNDAETRALNQLFQPLHVSFKYCDPLFVDLGGDNNNDADEDESGAGENNKSRIRRRELEEAIDAYERQGEPAPTTNDGYRKLLLSAPQSSYVWIRFAAHLVALSKIDEARDVLEEALRTLSVRESAERLNVWTAYLNLENLHGTAESLEAVFNRALQNSDTQLRVYERLAHIFKATRKKEQLLQLCRTMTGRFGAEPRVWELLCQAYIDQDKREALRRTIKQIQQGGGSSSSSTLKMADKTLVLQHVAAYEYRAGQAVHGRALFESLVSQRAKRSDVWSVYIDQEMALLARKDPAAAVKDVRKLFQRASSVQLPPRAMQQLMARFLKFEQTHGTAADVQNVKEAAQRYVQDRLAAASGVVNDETETGRRGGAAAAASSFGGGDADDDNNLLLDNAGPEEEQFDF